MPSENDASSGQNVSTDTEDLGLKMLNARRMLELRRKMAPAKSAMNSTSEHSPASKKPSDREIVLSALVDRGVEVLQAADSRYPKQMAALIPGIARLIKEKKIETISGGELLQFLRSLGLRVSVKTSISVEDHGKFISLADKLKGEM